MKTVYFQYGEKEINYLKQCDEALSKIIDQYGFIEREVIPDIYTGLLHTVVGQLLSTKVANVIFSRLEAMVGNMTPENVAQYSIEEIKQCGLTKRKSQTIKEITDRILKGELNLQSLQQKNNKEVIEELTLIKGIGEWSAEMILILTLQRKDVLSYKDLAIRRGLCRLQGLSQIDRETFEIYKQRYSPYGSIAALYLWKLSHEKEK
ncbi:DNA-3-methyladenine glycosylase II [Breznakia sp. PF5-3]|uniref:DNA-3-methyladenine glycosylase family protein n=1 Tax=unclassified Breznakia TaxID=2623764 RepID=UPI0024055099|nr:MULTISPECIES: DNA-3-methyladenine glycosylase 2 family protein [unclassified Breznakia]MDF9824119.1 DNA-3-methyladenine glycosylase II [Breznakia sp. PM6-1]MDF9834917.1 DNA-3-methyladenine glycosylase II [Breznakia sp. PF5-3]MDF9837214.1 DNA-3-methyladenine glycosylase II [Breznakia sp. PFB2-8]MDF9859204.1 DNA-3-methyladenine glycosylase II [Breznakia sp. PH5-24]